MPSDKRLVGLRVDDDLYAELERMAREERRSVASMADVLLRRGIERQSSESKRGSAKPRKR